MTNSSSSAQPANEPPTPEFCGGTTGFVMMIVMMFTIFIMFSPELRKSIAVSLDVVFDPIFGFDSKYPVLTLLCTSIFLVFCSTTIRHFMTDWVGIARAQKMMSAIQKEKTNAMVSGNTLKLKKIEEMNPEIAKHQMTLMVSNLKPIAFTMIFFIIVFPWIWMVYIESLDYSYVSLPGTEKWDLLIQINWCFGIPWGNWILIYIVLSFPLGFLIQNGLKYITFSRKIKQTEVQQHEKIEDSIISLEEKLKQVQTKGITVDKSRELITQARAKLSEKKYTPASNLINEADEYLHRKTQTHERVKGLITEAETMINNAKSKNIGMEDAQKSLNFAKNALKRNDETSAIYYAKQCQRKVKDSREQHKAAEETLSSVKAIMYDIQDLNTDEADQIFENAKKSMDNKDYTSVIKLSKATKTKAEEIQSLYQQANDSLSAAKKALESIQHLGLEVPSVDRMLEKANIAFSKHKYNVTIEQANQVKELINTEKEKFQTAQEGVSFAKLVISNAQSFGADVSRSEELVREAEEALKKKQYERAIDLGNKAKDIAEQLKRQQQRASKRR